MTISGIFLLFCHLITAHTECLGEHNAPNIVGLPSMTMYLTTLFPIMIVLWRKRVCHHEKPTENILYCG
jgi:hypothetical protein